MLRESHSVAFSTTSLSDRLAKQNPDRPRRPLSAIEYRARVDLSQDPMLSNFQQTSTLMSSTNTEGEDVDMTDAPLTDEQRQREREILAEHKSYRQARDRRTRRSVIGGGAVTDGGMATEGLQESSGSGSMASTSRETFFTDNDD